MSDRPIAKDIAAAVKAAQIYFGCAAQKIRISDEQKLYRSMNRKIDAVAKRRGMDRDDAASQIMEYAKKLGGICPIPGKDI